MINALIYFLTGGVVTTAIVLLEESGFRLLAGFALLMPIFTLIGYLFIGSSQTGHAVSQLASLVLLGTMVSWVPYMFIIIFLAPHIGTYRAIGIALAVFFILALIYLLVVQRLGWFQ
jgi:uncharacterized membrane protein (GlpM family)